MRGCGTCDPFLVQLSNGECVTGGELTTCHFGASSDMYDNRVLLLHTQSN